MAKNGCCVCGKLLGVFSNKYSLKDGVLCAKCLKLGGVSALDLSSKLGVDVVADTIKRKTDVVRSFRPDYDGGRIEIDSRNCLFRIDDEDYFFFDELVSYKYNEFPNSSTTHKADKRSGGAAIGGVIGGLGGGLVGGAIGAAVGGKIGSFLSAPCEYMNISIVLNNPLKSNIKLHFISQKTNISSEEYKRAYQRANECLEALQIIERHNADIQIHETATKTKTEKVYEERNVFVQEGHLTASQIADELNVYKTLWYDNVITEEEYNQKKRQLLSLK